MQKCQLNPTPNQTFEIVGTGEYDFSNVLRHSYELQERDKRRPATNAFMPFSASSN